MPDAAPSSMKKSMDSIQWKQEEAKKKAMERQKLIPRRISKDLKFSSFVLERQVGEKSRLYTDVWNKKANTITVKE